MLWKKKTYKEYNVNTHGQILPVLIHCYLESMDIFRLDNKNLQNLTISLYPWKHMQRYKKN